MFKLIWLFNGFGAWDIYLVIYGGDGRWDVGVNESRVGLGWAGLGFVGWYLFRGCVGFMVQEDQNQK